MYFCIPLAWTRGTSTLMAQAGAVPVNAMTANARILRLVTSFRRIVGFTPRETPLVDAPRLHVLENRKNVYLPENEPRFPCCPAV